MSYVNFSEQESSISGLRIGRTDILKNFDYLKLVDEIFDLKLDVCRLKIDLSNPEIYILLNKLNFPFHTYSFIIEQKLDLKFIDKPFDLEIDIQEYRVEKKEELLQLIRKIQQAEKFNVYYENEWFNSLFPENVLNEIIADYQTTFDNSINKNRHCFLAYDEQKLIGYCTLTTNETFGDAVLVGIIPEYRSKNIFKDLIRVQINKSKEVGCEYYYIKTIAFNSRSLNTSLKQNMKVNRVLLNINIFPLLSYKASNEDTINLEPSTILSSIEHYVYEKCNGTKVIAELKYQPQTEPITKLCSIKLYKSLNLIIWSNLEHSTYGYARLQ